MLKDEDGSRRLLVSPFVGDYRVAPAQGQILRRSRISLKTLSNSVSIRVRAPEGKTGRSDK